MSVGWGCFSVWIPGGWGRILPLGACGFRVLGVEHWWSLVQCGDVVISVFYWLAVEL